MPEHSSLRQQYTTPASIPRGCVATIPEAKLCASWPRTKQTTAIARCARRDPEPSDGRSGLDFPHREAPRPGPTLRLITPVVQRPADPGATRQFRHARTLPDVLRDEARARPPSLDARIVTVEYKLHASFRAFVPSLASTRVSECLIFGTGFVPHVCWGLWRRRAGCWTVRALLGLRCPRFSVPLAPTTHSRNCWSAHCLDIGRDRAGAVGSSREASALEAWRTWTSI